MLEADWLRSMPATVGEMSLPCGVCVPNLEIFAGRAQHLVGSLMLYQTIE